MHAIMGVGVIGLVGKLVRMDDSAKWFDGSSLGASVLRPVFEGLRLTTHYRRTQRPLPTAVYIFALSVYLSVGLPASRTIAAPVEGVDTRADQIEALRLLSAGNTIIIALLGMVLALQVRCRSPSLEALTSPRPKFRGADCPFRSRARVIGVAFAGRRGVRQARRGQGAGGLCCAEDGSCVRDDD